MKTKHILISLAATAAFAACTQDEELLVNNNLELNGRKVINSDLVFNFDFNEDDALTRLNIGNQITPTVGDEIGAALIDEVSNPGGGTEYPASSGYYLTTGISTNHPFTTENGTSWSTPTRLVEGNYLFYYQWNEKLGGSRKEAVPYAISNSQYAYKADAPTVFVPTQPIQDNNVGIGYTFLSADDEGLTPKNVSVAFKNLFAYLRFDFSTALSGVEIQQIVVKQGKANEKFVLKGTLGNTKIAQAHEKNSQTGVWEWNNQDEKYTNDYVTPGTTDADKSSEIILTLPDVAVTSNVQSTYMVIPAAEYNNTTNDANNNYAAEFIVDVYTNKGVWTRSVELDPDGDANYTTLYCGKIQPINIAITDNFKAADKYFVTSAEQWNKVLESLPVATQTNNQLNIQLLNDVALSAADIAKIQSTNAKDYTVNIDGEKLVLTENATLSDMNIEGLNVNQGVTAELGKDLIVNVLTNNGTININSVASPNKVAEVKTAFTNIGTATINAKAAIAGLNNAGTVTVSEGAELTLNSTSDNHGTINNSGMIVANGVFTNAVQGVFYNNAGGVLSNLYVSGTSNKVVNLGTIEAEEGSTTIVAENADDSNKGTINYEDGASVSVTDITKKGIIAYIVTSDYTVPTSSVEYNTIIVDAITLALTGADGALQNMGVTNITIKNGAVLDLSDYITNSTSLTLIKVEGANNRIIGSAILTTNLEVAAGGYLLIPLNSKVTATTLTNNGTVNVGGTLEYTNTGSVPGVLLGTGTITAK